MRPFRPSQNRFRISKTDAPLDLPLVNGWMRYSDFLPLDKGGSCVLRTALDRNLGRRVVIKTLHEEYENNDVMLRRFVREARITAQIQHPNTPPVYEIGRDQWNRPYFTMKQVAGRTLRSLIEGINGGDEELQKAYPLFRQLEIFTQVALAAAYAHACGVVHRDLKPANIQIGSFGEVVLLDWGLAKVLDDPEELYDTSNDEIDKPLELTRAGMKLGTPFYMSPEQVRGDLDLDHRSDIFSMGILLYEILTLEHLFQGEDAVDVRREVLEKPIIAPSQRPNIYRIPKELDDICLKALQRDPAERYQSLIDMVNDLDAFRAGGSISIPERDAPEA